MNFLCSYFFYSARALYKSMMYANKKEIVVRGDGNCFYRAIVMWRDQRHQEIRRSTFDLIEENQPKFISFLFAKKSVIQHVMMARKQGTWADTMDIFSCASLFNRSIYLYSMKSQHWLIFKPLVGVKPQSVLASRNKQSDCPRSLNFS